MSSHHRWSCRVAKHCRLYRFQSSSTDHPSRAWGDSKSFEGAGRAAEVAGLSRRGRHVDDRAGAHTFFRGTTSQLRQTGHRGVVEKLSTTGLANSGRPHTPLRRGWARRHILTLICSYTWFFMIHCAKNSNIIIKISVMLWNMLSTWSWFACPCVKYTWWTNVDCLDMLVCLLWLDSPLASLT